MSAAKKIKLDRGLAAPDGGEPTGGPAAAVPRSGGDEITIESLSVETISTVLGYLRWDEILLARVCRTFREAATRTIVPLSREVWTGNSLPDFCIYNMRTFDALGWMSRALPNLQELYFWHTLTAYLVFEDGEDPNIYPPEDHDPWAPPGWQPPVLPTRRINVIANFPKLRRLSFNGVGFNGKYPCLLGFPHLQRLFLCDVGGLKMDLETIAGSFPVLESLVCWEFHHLRGSIKSLGVLRDTLWKVTLRKCPAVHGDLLDLADLPLLLMLDLMQTPVTGDVRQIGENDFPALQDIRLPGSVCGSTARPFERVADASDVMNALCRLKERNGIVFVDFGTRQWSLAEDSLDRYSVEVPVRSSLEEPPFLVEIVEVGPYIGWRWTNGNGGVCKTNWLDQEPDKEVRLLRNKTVPSGEYSEFWGKVERSPFKDLANPPTEEEYQRLSTHW